MTSPKTTDKPDRTSNQLLSYRHSIALGAVCTSAGDGYVRVALLAHPARISRMGQVVHSFEGGQRGQWSSEGKLGFGHAETGVNSARAACLGVCLKTPVFETLSRPLPIRPASNGAAAVECRFKPSLGRSKCHRKTDGEARLIAHAAFNLPTCSFLPGKLADFMRERVPFRYASRQSLPAGGLRVACGSLADSLRVG